jgi:hypothetical protein
MPERHSNKEAETSRERDGIRAGIDAYWLRKKKLDSEQNESALIPNI